MHLSAAVRERKSVPFKSQERRELVQRVLASAAFCKAPAMCAFLLYVTQQAEIGQADQLKEQTIGVEVLGRRPEYDPAKDNIVRVRANELRGRLARYFASEGINEPVVITIPRGGYGPEFAPREVPAELTPRAPEISAGGRGKHGRRWLVRTLLIAITAGTSCAVIARYWFRASRQPANESTSRAVLEFWTPFFAKPTGTLTIVYSDSGIALWQRQVNKDLNLGDYLSHKYLNSQGNELVQIASQRATSPADINTSLRIQGIGVALGGQVSAQFARNINADLLHRGNIVLIGSRRSNPWVEVYEPTLNFQLRINPKTRSPEFFNHSPRANESPVYGIPDLRETDKTADGQFIEEAEKKEFVSYGVVALKKECGTNRLVLLLEGLNLQATQAAGDLVTDPQMLEQVLDGIGQKPGSNLSPFEALFQITSLPGGYDNARVVATRVQPAGACFAK